MVTSTRGRPSSAREIASTPMTRPRGSHCGRTPISVRICASITPSWRLVSTPHRLNTSLSGQSPLRFVEVGDELLRQLAADRPGRRAGQARRIEAVEVAAGGQRGSDCAPDRCPARRRHSARRAPPCERVQLVAARAVHRRRCAAARVCALASTAPVDGEDRVGCRFFGSFGATPKVCRPKGVTLSLNSWM